MDADQESLNVSLLLIHNCIGKVKGIFRYRCQLERSCKKVNPSKCVLQSCNHGFEGTIIAFKNYNYNNV